jgi:hypothetical protein
VDIKLWSDELEGKGTVGGQRKVNIDPGYICLEQVMLATGKNYIHRIYLDRGVFANLTLIYEKGSFKAIPWTFPDYSEDKTIEMFNKLRNNLIKS